MEFSLSWSVFGPLLGIVGCAVAIEGVKYLICERIAVATIATVGDRAQVTATSHVRLVGYDLHVLVSSEYEALRDLIRKWTATGARITYIVHRCSPAQLAEFRKRRDDFDPDGLVTLLVVNQEMAPSSLIEESRERHWATFSSPAQLWTEAEHHAGKVEAKNCEFVKFAWLDLRYFKLQWSFRQLARGATSLI